MPFNGSGQFNLLYNWQNDAAQGLNISSSRMQGQDADIASGLSDCVTKDGQTIPTANLPMGGFRHTNVGNAQYPTDYATLGQIQNTGLKILNSNGTPEWLAFSDTPTYVSATQFTVPGNLTARYSVGRRVRASVTAGTVYGTIASSAYTTLTTISLILDSGSLDSGLTEVDIGILNSSNPSLPAYPSVSISGAPATNRTLTFQSAGVNRWIIETDSTVESGTNTGSNFEIISCPDSGAIGASAMTITRANNNVTFSGTVTAANITGSSDERLKENWRPMARDFLDRMASVRRGTFDWKSGGSRSAGVSAQSLREVLPEVVHEDEKGVLSVAYGNAALVAVLELIPLVLRLLDAHGERS